MSIESAVQRMLELRSMVSNAASARARGAAADGAAAFQASLTAAGQQLALSPDGSTPPASLQSQSMLPGGGATPAMGMGQAAGYSGMPGAMAGMPGAYPGMSTAIPGIPGPAPGYGVSPTYAGYYTTPGLIPGMQGAPGTMPYGGGAGGVGEQMVQLAQRELGVRETNGGNESPRIREYRTATAGAEGTPGPWCAYFVSWLARNAGAPIGEGGRGTGWVPTIERWGKQEGRFFTDSQGIQPRAGDIVIFDNNGDGLADHTGIVEFVGPDGKVHTIEGNTSDMVARRSYSPGGRIAGYVRPG